METASGPESRAASNRRWPARVALAAVATVLSLLAGDCLCRHLELPAARGPLAWRASWGPKNSLGFRGPEPAASRTRPRLLLLGDSQVEAVSLHDFNRAPGPSLQRYLGRQGHPWEVVSMGAGGWGTDQQFIALQHYFARLDPDAVVLFTTLENDVIENLFCKGSGGPKPTYLPGQDGMLIPPPVSLWAPPGSLPSHGLLPLARRILGPSLPTDVDWDSTMPAASPAPRVTCKGELLTDFLRELYGFSPRLKLADLEAGRVSWAMFRLPTPWRVVHALALQEALLAAMRDHCASRGVPLFVFKQRDPSMQARWKNKSLILEGHELLFSPGVVEKTYRQMMVRLKIPFLDVHLDHRSHTMLPQDPHLNAQGYAVLARQVGRWLLGRPRFLAKSKRTANMSPRR